MAEPTRTALGSARERFVNGLRERGRELEELCAALERDPHSAELPARLLRKLHALYASAQVFADRGLLTELGQLIAGLEAARDLGKGPGVAELVSLRVLIERSLGAERDELPTLRPPGPEGEPPAAARSSVRPAVVLGAFETQAGKVPVPVTSTVAGTFSSPQIIAVLALAGPSVGAAVRAALPIDQCELTTTGEPDTALAAIDQVAPDVVLVESRFLSDRGAELVRRLRGERAGIRRNVVALVSETEAEVEALLINTGADAARRVPVPGDGFLQRVMQWGGRGPTRARGLSALTAGTVDEIARSVAEEVRRGIADSLRSGRSERLELDDKSELMAAAWSAVARIRAHLAEEAEGRIRFDDAAYAGGPAVLALTGRSPEADAQPPASALAGRRVLIADDDPAVLRVFADLLRASGAEVIEAEHGARALELARSQHPDLVVSDILMPEIDGFTLCRELKRDLTLCHVPVILLSWKEDFLQRMRELDAGASGYLRKESDSAQILHTLSEALRPEAELTALLAQGGEVQGRSDAIGVPRLLERVAQALPDARISLRDAWNLFEIDIRHGDELAVTRTASDGSFARGPTALRQLLGVEAGRFAVTEASGALRGELKESLAIAVADGVAQLGAVLDAVSDNRLMAVQRVTFDDEILASLLTATPTALADLAQRLREGASVAELLLSGAYAPREIERQLRELSLRGAVIGVWSKEGEDLVASARRARKERPREPLHSAPPAPIAPPVAEAQAEEPESVRPRRRRELVMSALPEPTPDAAGSEAQPALSAESEARASRPPAAGPSASPSAPPSASKPPEAFTVQSALLRAATSQRPRASTPPAAWERPRPPPLRTRTLAASLVVLIAVGFFGWRVLRTQVGPIAARSPASTQVSALEGAAEAKSTQAGPPGPKLESATRALPYIDPDRRANMGKDEGLLVIEYTAGAGAPPRVRIGGRDLGAAPLTTALQGGRHEVLLKRGDQTSFRYVVIHPGETRILTLSE